MKTFRWVILSLAAISVLSILGVTMKQNKESRETRARIEDLWKKAERAQSDGLPQTAAGHLKDITSLALKIDEKGQALKALVRRLALESVVQGNKPAERIVRLKEEMSLMPAELQPVMKLILAQWYWHYFQRNRWRFLQRSETAGLDEKDFTTWDLPRLYREIDSLYRDVLKADVFLKATDLKAFEEFLEEGSGTAALRPTLFDFASWEALGFYLSGEQAAAKPEDAFEIPADSVAFGPAEEFLSYAPETTDTESPKLQAIRVFQGLLSFHRGDSRPEAYLDADLSRLLWLKNVAVGEGVSDLYLAGLKNLVEAYPGSELSSKALWMWAEELFEKGEPAAALEVASRGAKAFPQSVGGLNCAALSARILAKEVELKAEAAVMPGRPSRLAVGYRNITRLHFRLIREDFFKLVQGGEEALSPSYLPEDRILALLAKEAVSSWSSDLKPTTDYKKAEALVEVPALEPGLYRLLSSVDKDFSLKSNRISATTLWVSRLGLVLASTSQEDVSGTVVHNDSGEPWPGVALALYAWDYGQKSYQEAGRAVADVSGHFRLPRASRYSSLLLTAEDKSGNILATDRLPWSYSDEPESEARTVLFTDRSLYRPGQMIRFKGICLRLDQVGGSYAVLPRRQVQIELRDVNDEEVSSLQLLTNDFGSFSGTFVAPADRLMGGMSIVCPEPEGSAEVRVEEYKRPKFQVKLDVPEKEFKLNDEVEVGGEATAYTGAPLDDAQVRYRIVREVRLPPWWLYWHGGGKWDDSQEIAHGTVRTDADGKFSLRFPARPDPAVPLESLPVFSFVLNVDVTDSAGETRSTEGRLRVGAVSLEAGLAASAWLEAGEPVELKVTASTLNGKPAAAAGTVEVFALKGPEAPVPADLIGETAIREEEARRRGERGFAATADWRKWPEGPSEGRKDFKTSPTGEPASFLRFDLGPGAYKARLTTVDKAGQAVEAVEYFLVLAPGEKTFRQPMPFHAAVKKDSLEVGETFELLWATGYERGPLLIEVLRDNRKLKRYWTSAGETQGLVRVPVDDSLKGGFTVVTSLVKENRLYQDVTRVSVPWSDRRLDLKWTTFRSKLLPGQKERWALKILGPGALPAAAELVATLYDASLDQIFPHGFPGLEGIFASDRTSYSAAFHNREISFSSLDKSLNRIPSLKSWVYVRFPEEVWRDLFSFEFAESKMMPRAAPPPSADAPMEEMAVMASAGMADEDKGVEPRKKNGKPAPDLSAVQARKNLNETAFFFPQLLADKDGSVSLEFTMPEALTEWRFLGLAHAKSLASGSLEGTTVTQKDLMVQPNPPRFLREGDVLEFSVKVTNMTPADIQGAVQLTFTDPASEKPRDVELGNRDNKKNFSIPAKQSRSFFWRLQVPEGLEVVAFKAVAATDKHSDGEEGWLPVLSRRLFVQESIPLWISGQGQKSFSLDKLAASAASRTLVHQGLSLQMTSNPAWYAVQALPYLMEFPYECSEQVFNRLYANSLARHIALSDTKIRRVFELWKGTAALDSNLEKNEELKSVLLQESPWVREAKSESQAKKQVGLLFDDNRLEAEIKSAYRKLEDMMEGDAWPWFPGGRPDRYISLYIVTGFGRLKNMGVTTVPQDLALEALPGLDAWAIENYEDLARRKVLDQNNLGSTAALYLYGRSFFLKDHPIPEEAKKAVDYFLAQAKAHWLKLGYRQSQGHLALALNRFGFPAEAQKIMRSLKERSLANEEMGRYWGEQEFSWWWYLAPIETQALMIEAFDEVMNDAAAVEECKVWLLKQKQTRDWKTTKATADAVYGLLRRGANLLASEALVEVRLGENKVEPEKAEAGTGYYEKRYSGSEVKPSMGRVTLVKTDKGIAWGGLHWRYLEDIAAVTPHAQNPLKLKKAVFVRRSTKKGLVIEPASGPLEVGDMVVVRIELRSDRDMEYVHMRDHRGSGLEPVNVLSGYKHQDGLWYYESTRDTATHFFIDFLPRGTYVFEYSLKVVHRGSYQSGLALIECMYAPEFNSHSESVALEVK